MCSQLQLVSMGPERLGTASPFVFKNRNAVKFLSRVSILTRDIDIANLSVCLSVRPSVCPLRSGTR